MPISIIPDEAELRRIRARVTEVAWMIRALASPCADDHAKALLSLVKSWPDHQVQSLAAMLTNSQQLESREASLNSLRLLLIPLSPMRSISCTALA
jgi:hypothetical protein